jgi:protein-tyrosine-phosphatase
MMEIVDALGKEAQIELSVKGRSRSHPIGFVLSRDRSIFLIPAKGKNSRWDLSIADNPVDVGVAVGNYSFAAKIRKVTKSERRKKAHDLFVSKYGKAEMTRYKSRKDVAEIPIARRVLVICKSNAGRSQVAQGLLEKCFPDSEVTSAGTNVREEHRDGFPVPVDIVEAVHPLGLDLRGRKRAQLIKELADWADDIIVTMEKNKMVENFRGLSWWPRFEIKTVYWNISDPTAEGRTPEKTVAMIKTMREYVSKWCEKRAQRDRVLVERLPGH